MADYLTPSGMPSNAEKPVPGSCPGSWGLRAVHEILVSMDSRKGPRFTR